MSAFETSETSPAKAPAIDLTNAAIVAAHPDDEILWFGSLVPRVGRIIICYGPVSTIPERAAQRRRALAAYPFNTVEFLDLPEPGLGAADEPEPHFALLLDRLAGALRGVDTVFTHSPWGEYGHLDHLRANAAVNALQGNLDFSTYITSYVARHRLLEFNEALEQGIEETLSFPIDRAVVEKIAELYKTTGCWTWARRWGWPEIEHFLRLGDNSERRATAFPFQVFDVELVRGG